MSPRHIGALSLIGWYLMVPPLASKNGPVVREAPLGKWDTLSVFDAAADCQTRLEAIQDSAVGRIKAHPVGEVSPQRLRDLQLLSAECIATDDPRLKSN